MKKMRFTPRTTSSKRYSWKKKKIFRRKRASRPKLYRSVKAGVGFPRKMTMTHRYYETIDINSAAGSTAIVSFRANGMYDPNYTGTGHQPLYFDQMNAIYNHWTVIGSKITVNCAHAATSNTNSTVCLYLNDDTTVTPVLNSLIEQSKAKYVVMPVSNVDPYRLTMGWSLKKEFGTSKGCLINTTMGGTATADPTEQSIYTVAIFPQNVSSTQTYNLEILITYIAVWTELKDIGGS